MAMNSDYSKFDELVSGISSTERKVLLSKLTAIQKTSPIVLQRAPDDVVDTKALRVKYSSESIFYKFYVWLRSLFSKKDNLTIYNDDLIGEIAHKVNKMHPGLIDHSNSLVLSLFYEKLKELRECASFIAPYLNIVDEDVGKFYVFLSSFLSHETTSAVLKVSDPYNIPFENSIQSDTKTVLVRKMEEVLSNIKQDTDNILYTTIKGINWLRQFSLLPFNHFLSQFTAIISTSYTCPYSTAQGDYPAIVKVLSSPSYISQEAIQSLYLYPHKNNLSQEDEKHSLDTDLNNFTAKFTSSISAIQAFISSVPLRLIGKVIFNNYDWEVVETPTNEAWFKKYKEGWKKIFDARWRDYLRDRKKYELTAILQHTFNLTSFPELPTRPWTKIWGGIPFNCEMTAGFLFWCASNIFKPSMETLNGVLLEGVFVNKDTRARLSEAINNYSETCEQVLSLVASFGPNGTVGSIFVNLLDEPVRTIKSQQTVDNVIRTTETSMREYGKTYCNSIREIEKIFNSILDESKDNLYGSLQNLLTIKGHENKKFRLNMRKTCDTLNVARTILAEIEPLDSVKV